MLCLSANEKNKGLYQAGANSTGHTTSPSIERLFESFPQSAPSDVADQQSMDPYRQTSAASEASLESPYFWLPNVSDKNTSTDKSPLHAEADVQFKQVTCVEDPRTSGNEDQAHGNVGAKGWRPDDVFKIGYVDKYGDWRCSFKGCKSKTVYERACDLRKHYNGHVRRYFCSEDDCEWAITGFPSKKDLLRHSATHKPQFRCPMIDCDRTFSRAGKSFAYECLNAIHQHALQH